MNYFSRK